MSQKQTEPTKQQKRISPELAEVLHMLKSLESQQAPAPVKSAH